MTSMARCRKRKRANSEDRSSQNTPIVRESVPCTSRSNGEKLSNVIYTWKSENTSAYRLPLPKRHSLSNREKLVHSTPWIKEFILNILVYPGFRKEITGRLRFLSKICGDPLREVLAQKSTSEKLMRTEMDTHLAKSPQIYSNYHERDSR